ncbi:MAG: hypothetical protein H0V88_14400 [Pyrinomonadaceae bacterium]|nr:hypothetical protein [Pyrinomonadaceae bacterium]
MVLFRRYKEIILGALLGFAMWIVDAAMHAQLAADFHSSNSFSTELLHPGSVQLIFRSLFVLISMLFGWALWRANWRERELEALERAIIAFHRRLDSPAMRIVSRVRVLQGRPTFTRDDVAQEIIAEIGEDARRIDNLAQSYIRFSEQVMAGRNGEAVETLRAIEARTQESQAAATTDAPPVVR